MIGAYIHGIVRNTAFVGFGGTQVFTGLQHPRVNQSFYKNRRNS